jgi:hypothetical protein
MSGQSDEGYVLTFTLLGENPNKSPLPLRQVSYSLSLDGKHVFQGTRSAQATLPAKGSQALTLPVSIPNDVGAGKGAEGAGADEPPPAGAKAKYRIAGSIEYQLPGSIAELLFDSQIRRPKAGFGESGVFEFTEAPTRGSSTLAPAPSDRAD